MDVWEKVLLSNDQAEAKRMDKAVCRLRIEGETPYWGRIADVIGYPRTNIIHRVGFINGHFLRTLNEIKLLSVFGGHTWSVYQKETTC